MAHPDPPDGCPFFRVRNGELEFSPSAFAVEHDEYSLDQDCFPAKRFAAACVAIVWLVPEGSLDVAVAEIHFQWCIYRKQARAEMEASNG